MIEFIISFVGCALLAWGLASLEMIPWRHAAEAHWTERARLLHHARAAHALNVWLLTAVVSFAVWGAFGGERWAFATGAAYFGGLVGGFALDRAAWPELTFRRWLYLLLATLVMQGTRWATLLAAAFAMPRGFSAMFWVIGAGCAALQLALQFGLVVRLLRWLRLLRPASARLLSLVAETAGRLKTKVERTWELDVPQANALAFVQTGELAFTSKFLAVASDEEVKAVCAHEIGHLLESPRAKLGRIVTGLGGLPLVCIKPVNVQFGSGGVVALGFITLAVALLGLRFARKLEQRADRIAVESESEKSAYARALELIHRANAFPAVLRRRTLAAHPNLYDRLLAANVTPDYPRPEPPAAVCWTSAVLMAAVVFTMLIVAGQRT